MLKSHNLAFLMLTFLLLCVGRPLAQSTTTEHIRVTNAVGTYSDWTVARQIASTQKLILVITKDAPNRAQRCNIKSMNDEKLECNRAFGAPRVYSSGKVLALLTPSDDALRVKLVLAMNAAMGAAIWGTVVLAPTCPVCAVGTGVAALAFFLAAGVTLIADGRPESYFYLAGGSSLGGRFAALNALQGKIP